MRRSLLDVNVLLALHDSEHLGHGAAHAWLAGAAGGWASCAITQNGFIRIISQPRYPQPVSVRHAIALLRRSFASSDHEQWLCDVTLVDPARIDDEGLLGPKQVTDAYLLALAVAHGGRLVTLDRSVPLQAVLGATEEHLLVL